MATPKYALGIGRGSAGQWQPIANRAADFGVGRPDAESTDFWRKRSD